MVLETMVAIICAMALVMGLIRVVQWRTEIAIVQYRQNQTAEKYGFNPGNIISDGQFFNGNAMSQAEIQAFLDKEGASCTGSQCLRVMTFDSENEPAGSECEAYRGAQGETAAAIISKSAKACGVSPKVLLTVLQKEQHLVTATSTTAFQFKAAMGLSCPDDASCDPQYAGFFRQVYGAAKRYKYYLQHEDTYGYHAGSMNYIQYNPNASCGGSQVYIENKATALLYIYTPYQPNTAALAAGAGEGDSCSAYGNRNFSIIYTGWFGNPRS
ncbi:hemagglutinin [Bifidobacterium thermophilum]|uniref:Hemagglutinin n=1 Tax=Bifidobacterium thermophilum TaxID=33905 RepID=A0A7X9NRX2_9BIFI|nr:hemagglutinin [Bifidobacterium thermophilum]